MITRETLKDLKQCFKPMDLRDKFLVVEFPSKDGYTMSDLESKQLMGVLTESDSGCLGIIHVPKDTRALPMESIEQIISELIAVRNANKKD